MICCPSIYSFTEIRTDQIISRFSKVVNNIFIYNN